MSIGIKIGIGGESAGPANAGGPSNFIGRAETGTFRESGQNAAVAVSRAAIVAAFVLSGQAAAAARRVPADPGVFIEVGLPADGSVTTGPQPGVVAPPSGFTMTPPMATTRAANGTFTTDYDIVAQRANIAYTGTIFVKPAGNNTLDGLSLANAVASLNKALALANARAAPTRILVDPGTYRYSSVANTFVAAFGGQTPTVDIVIECSTPGSKVISLCDVLMPAYSATGTDATVYVSSYTTETPTNAVIDLAQLDARGRPKALRRCFPASNVESVIVAAINARVTQYGQGSFYLDTTNKKLYVKRIASAAPDANLVAISSASTNNLLLTSTAANRKLWMRDVELWGSNIGFRVTSASGRVPLVWVYNCAYCYTGSSNGFLINSGGGQVVHVGTQHESCMQDGFNYNGIDGGTCPDFVEIGCRGWDNGWGSDGDTSSNGSSANVQVRGIRVNCIYTGASNRVIHDLQGALTWNLAVTAGPTRLTGVANYSGNFSSGFLTLSNTSKMWLDACVSDPGSDYAFQAYDGGQIFFANMDDTYFAQEVSGVGSNVTRYVSTVVPTSGATNGAASFKTPAGARLLAAIL